MIIDGGLTVMKKFLLTAALILAVLTSLWIACK